MNNKRMAYSGHTFQRCLQVPIWLQVITVLMSFHSSERLSAHGRGFRPIDAVANATRPAQKVALDRTQSDFQITERDRHHQVWERVSLEPDESGQLREVVHSYTELGSNLNYWDNAKQSWEPSRELIEPVAGGAIARYGGQQVRFAGDLNIAGAVEILGSDGVRLKSSVIGLAYRDSVSGRRVVLGSVKSARGKILPPNRVIFRDAFTDIKADVLYIYKRSGVIQDVILREQPRPPADFGFSPEAEVTLEVLTEFFESPDPEFVKRSAQRPSQYRDRTASPSSSAGQDLRFGETRFADGIAFSTQAGNAVDGETFEVAKRWEVDGERKMLSESVSYDDIIPQLDGLPVAGHSSSRGLPQTERRPEARFRLPAVSFDSALADGRPLEEGEDAPLSEAGFVVDYNTITGSQSSFVFEAGETYLLSGSINFYATTTFEGGAVIKHSNNSYLLPGGDMIFNTSEFAPVVFTSVLDDTEGEVIDTTDPAPSAPYDSFCLWIGSWITGQEIKHVRMKYCAFGIYISGGGFHRIRDMQFRHGGQAVVVTSNATGVVVENALFDDFSYGFNANPGTVTVEHLTAHNGGTLTWPNGISMKNSLVVDVNLIHAYGGRGESHNVELTSASGVFQTVGGGHRYLASGSPYRDVGTSQINPELKYELERRTTSPPAVVDAPVTYSTDVTWTPHVPRDDDGSLDIGYHYPAIDYLVDSLRLDQGATLTVDAGTSIAAYGNMVFWMRDHATLSMLGTVTNPIHVAWYGDLQGETDPNLVGQFSHTVIYSEDLAPVGNQNVVDLNFCRFHTGSFVTGEKYAIRADSFTATGISELRVKNCYLDGMAAYVLGNAGDQHEWINNYFYERQVNFKGEQDLSFFNNYVKNLRVIQDQTGATYNWEVKDNVFQALSSSSTSTGNILSGYNAFVGTSFRISGGQVSSDVTRTVAEMNTSIVTGPFGEFYQNGSNSFQNAGSRTAAAAGLYHYTSTWPVDTKEGSSTVDIGLHYPSTTPGTGGN